MAYGYKYRQSICNKINSWVGLTRTNGSHKPIIDMYNNYFRNNKISPPRNYCITMKDSYCAATVSAAAIACGLTDIIPLEVSCYYMIENAKKMGCWVEDDKHCPKPGDIILYDWDDKTSGYSASDNTNSPDHIGIVTSVSGNNFVVTEGNLNGAVAKRNMTVNGRYIRGYICPKYREKEVREVEKEIKDYIDGKLAAELNAGQEPVYKHVEDFPEYYRGVLNTMIDKGWLKGEGTDDKGVIVNMSVSTVRAAMIALRAQGNDIG